MFIYSSYPVYHPVVGGYISGGGIHISNTYGVARVTSGIRTVRTSPIVVPSGGSFSSARASSVSAFKSSGGFSARSSSMPSSVSRGGMGSVGRASASVGG